MEKRKMTKKTGAELMSQQELENAYEQMCEAYIRKGTDFDTRDFLDYYFEEHFPGSKIILADTFKTSNGFVYEILKPVYEE